MTIVEAIKQLLISDPKTRIVACAPSNSAADLIALRLRDSVTKDEMFRMYAPSRYKDQAPDELEPFTYYRDDFENRPSFGVPPFATMKRYRVIVSTCVAAAMLTGIGMTRGHFSHIFIDEAGQATEPEAFVSVKTLADTATNVVLSGDPKQLGPIIRSGIACSLGLEVSYLERLMARPPYDLQVGSGKRYNTCSALPYKAYLHVG
jgi:helicase MOV-10